MQTFLIAALAVVLVVGIPLAVLLGRLSKGKGSSAGASAAGAATAAPTTAPPAAPAPAAPAPAPAPAPAAAPKKKHFWGSGWFWIVLLVALAGIVAAVLWYLGMLPRINLPEVDASAPGELNIPVPHLSGFQWLVLGILLVVAALFIFEKRKGWEWVRNGALGIGVLIIIAILVMMSSAWEPAAKVAADCIHTGMCMKDDGSSSSSSLSSHWEELVEGGTYTVRDDAWLEFSKVKDMCIGYTPSYGVDVKSDRTRFFIRSFSGEREVTLHLYALGETDEEGNVCV